ncbi:MAG: helix-hairpin-helix domain-containing protein [Thermoplasmata archaeon]
MAENERTETEVIAEFTKIPGLGLKKAKKLYDKGYRSIEDLKRASFEELASIDGIGESRATLIKNYFAELEEKSKQEEKAMPEEAGSEEKGKEEKGEIEPKIAVEAEEKKEVEREEVVEEKEVVEKEAKFEEKVAETKEVTETEEEIAKMEKELEEVERVVESSKGKEAKIVFEEKVKPREGLINGVPIKKGYKLGRRKTSSMLRYVAIGLISVLILASIITIWYAILPESPISIDGRIDDWHGVATYREDSRANVSSIEVVEYGMLFEERRVNFFARTQGDIFGTTTGVEVLRIFIDADSTAETGYQYRGFGAEYKIEVTGWEGTIHSANLQRFSTDANAMNYSAWENAGEVRVEKSANIVEGCIKLSGLNNARAIFVMSYYEAQNIVEKVCGAPASPKYKSLGISQRYIGGDVVHQGDEVLEIKLVARGGEVQVNSISVENADVALPKNTIGKDEEIVVKATAKSLSEGKGYNFKIAQIGTDAPYLIEGNGGSAYFGTLPAGIVIDGAFGDWAGKHKGVDAKGDARPDTDLVEYAAEVSNNAYFYMAVDGTMLAGCEIPSLGARPSPQPGPVGPVVLKENLGLDIARVYIDLLNSTINTFNPAMISHGYLIELQGRNGQVISAKAWNWENGMRAREVGNANIVYGINNGKIEFSADMSVLAGVSPDSKFYFEMTNWLGEKDVSEFAYTRDFCRNNNLDMETVVTTITMEKVSPMQTRQALWLYGNITPAGTYYIRITNQNTGQIVTTESDPTGYFGTLLATDGNDGGAEPGDTLLLEVFTDPGYTNQVIVNPSIFTVTSEDFNNQFIGGPAKDLSATVEMQLPVFSFLLIGVVLGISRFSSGRSVRLKGSRGCHQA